MKSESVNFSNFFYFYEEDQFKKLMSLEHSTQQLKEYGSEMLEWFHSNVHLINTDILSKYICYLNAFCDVNDIRGISIDKEKINRIFKNTENFICLNMSEDKSLYLNKNNFVHLYLDFKANAIDKQYWFLRLKILFTDRLFYTFLKNSTTFYNISNLNEDVEKISFLSNTLYKDMSFYSGKICEKIGSELTNNKIVKENDYYMFLYSLFNKNNVFGI